MNRYQKLGWNTLIISIGNFGTKFMAFLMVPFYTFFLSPSEYGKADLYVIAISVLVPVCTLSIGDALFRFSVNNNENQKKIFSTAMLIPTLMAGVIIFSAPIVELMFNQTIYYWMFILLLLLQSINTIFQQYIRAIGKLILYSSIGIVSSIVLFGSSVIFLKNFSMGIKGYLLAQIITVFISMCIYFFVGKLWAFFNYRLIDLKTLKFMSNYSIPLIPNAVMWWVMLMSDRYIISFFMGTAATGIYLVASKIPSVLSLIHGTFMQAWHLSAIENAGSDGRKFYAQIFYVYFVLLGTISSVLIIIIEPLTNLIFSEAYQSVWQYTPLLLLSILFLSLSSFLEAYYIVEKKTVRLMRTTIIGAFVNIILTVLMVPFIGITGACMATFISFFITWFIRSIETRLFDFLRYKAIFVSSVLILIFQSVLLTYTSGDFMLLQGICAAIFISINIFPIKKFLIGYRKTIKKKMMKN